MTKRSVQAEDLLRLIFVGDPQIDPSGTHVLFGHKQITDRNEYLTHLWTVDLEGNLRQLTRGPKSCGQGRWSPDGRQIAFLSAREADKTQLYLLSLDGGEAQRLTNLPEGSLSGLRWSPNGSMIAFQFRAQIADRTKEATTAREASGGSEPPIICDSVYYREDGDGYFGNERFRVYVIDVRAAQAQPAEIGTGIRQICDADPLGDYDFSWSPDSQELALIRHLIDRPFAEPPNRQIWRVNVETGESRMLPGLPKGTKHLPRWSPDGTHIAYIGDTDDRDPWGTRNQKVYLVSAEGGEPKDLTGAQDYDFDVATLSDTKDAASAAVMEWSPDGAGLFAQVGTRGESHIAFVSKEGGVQLLTEGRISLGFGNVSADGHRLAAVRGDAVHPFEVAVVEPELATGRMVPRLLTGFNLPLMQEVQLQEPEEAWVPTTDGLSVHTWVLKPVGHEGDRRYPAVLQIHGGPHTQYGWSFFHEMQLLAAQGYVVVYSNPRGSKGYGESWTTAIRGHWGHKDWEDIQAVTSWMKAHPAIDSSRMAVMGGSYGGYMTNWVIGHTHDFACAITDRCVSNLVSMAGSSDFPFNKDGYFRGVAWGSLEDIRELWHQSPLAYFQGVKTPTLVIHSAGDLRCNIEQAEQVFTALQMEGIPSRLVRYPASTSHGMSRTGPPDLRLHRLGEISRWLGRFLQNESVPAVHSVE